MKDPIYRFANHILSGIVILSVLLPGCRDIKQIDKSSTGFDGERAYQDVIDQEALGARLPGSQAHAELVAWLIQELEQNHWEVELQTGQISGKTVKNIIASRPGEGGYLLLGAHYDTRIFADLDPNPELRQLPVPGANDGGSGVAVLLELSRQIPQDLSRPLKLVFFDAEDNGGIGDWDWILGSRFFVNHYQSLPEAVVIVDMVGDADLQIYYEYNSDSTLLNQIWGQAERLGHSGVFIDEYKHALLDDHTPFIEAGIPAVDLIDYDYPYWHTTADTSDKVSPESLQIVGETLLSWILAQQN